MQSTQPKPDVKALEAALAAARALVASLEAALAAAGDDRTELLDVKAVLAEYGVGRDGLLAAAKRGEVELSRGSRDQILVARGELERWMKSRAPKPRRRNTVASPANDLAAWDAEQERELRALECGQASG